MHQHRACGRHTTIPTIAIDYGYLNERDVLLQEAAGAPILVSKCNRDRWIGLAIVPTKGADEYAVAELKNNVIGSGFTEVLIRSDNEPAILAVRLHPSQNRGRSKIARSAEIGMSRYLD